MDELNLRFGKIIKALGKTHDQITVDLGGMSRSTISRMVNGKSPVTKKIISDFHTYYGVNEEYFRSGEGDMFADSKKIRKMKEVFDSLSPDFQDLILHHAEETLKVEKKLRNKDQKK